MSDADLPAELKSLAARLGQLSPTRADRDRLLFEAGRRSVRPSRVWPVSTAILGLLALGLVLRPSAMVERIEYVERSVPTSTPFDAPDPGREPSYLKLRDQYVVTGVIGGPTEQVPLPSTAPLRAGQSAELLN